ncbi:SRPBCC domain-containing protein [Spongiibacter tropicus]|uniref:SRPBCC domain-containing protein n=1 Tax=Spongiibacter tropicus TaxID=454602 RepID=UPI0023526292|nr:SRPBCC domain-containing protein [Spongiibacter tropicus]|tara:strand:+ start:376 stop:834 length:459 start_codon:yes stop_codon:yes gene_type:complete
MFPNFHYTTELHINADAEAVYAAIADFNSYSQWNPWLIQAGGVCAEGELVDVTVRLGRRVMSVQHKVLETVPGRVLRWCDLGWFTKAAYGERCRTIEPLATGGVRYRNELPVTGPLAWLAHLFTGRALQQGMQAENEALKRFVESGGSTPEA